MGSHWCTERGRKVCRPIAAMLAGATRLDQVDIVRADSTRAVLPFKVTASSTTGTCLRTFTFDFIRQLEALAIGDFKSCRVSFVALLQDWLRLVRRHC